MLDFSDCKYKIGQRLYREEKYEEAIETFEASIVDSSTGTEEVFLSKFGIALCYLKLKDLENSYKQLLNAKEYLNEKYIKKDDKKYYSTPKYILKEDYLKEIDEIDCRYINNTNVYNLLYNIEYLKIRIEGINFLTISVMYNEVEKLAEEYGIDNEPSLRGLLHLANKHKKNKNIKI